MLNTFAAGTFRCTNRAASHVLSFVLQENVAPIFLPQPPISSTVLQLTTELKAIVPIVLSCCLESDHSLSASARIRSYRPPAMGTLLYTAFAAWTLKALHVLSPVAVIMAYSITSLAHVFGSKKQIQAEENHGSGTSLHRACLASTVLIMTSYISEAILLACILPGHAATSSDENLAFVLFSSLAWLVLLLGLIDTSPSDIGRIFSPAWILALVFDTLLLALSCWMPKPSGRARAGRLSLQAIRIALLMASIGVVIAKYLIRRTEKGSDEEIAPLISRFESHLNASGARQANANAYGTATADDSKKKATGQDSSPPNGGLEYEDSDDEDEDNAEIGKLRKDWWVYTKAFAIFLPHLWPKKSIRLQLHFPALALCLLASRVLNVLIPLQLGIIVNVLRSGESNVLWTTVCLYIGLRFLESSAGISLVQSWLWMPINSYSTVQLSAAAYDQVMNLSCDFHDSKKSGRTWRIVGRGESLADLVHTIGFEMIPMAADLVIAVTVFWWLFDAYMAFIVALSSFIFLWATMKTIPFRTKRQREFIKAWEDEYTQMTESSLNWPTVAYFNRICYEQNRYKNAVQTTQGKMIKFRVVSMVIGALRSLTLQVGLMVAALLAAYQISKGKRNVGDFVVLITYWSQLTAPLSYFANGFSRIARSLVDAEKLLELLQTKPTVGNHEDATEFILKQGQVDFDRVYFSYDGQRQVADNLSFRIEPGQTVALVGETGGGKSTMLKLLFRFYDVTGGCIMIDGQDVRHVTLESLRANIGCVPQDPILFNQTILQNLRYAKLDATDEEIQAACKAVALHEKIMSFTKGYSEKVGERGVKLSGGELQRMAIARAILKDPKILLLDEATSSVDSETEAVIQSSFRKLCAGRTTFVVAHRLSTIVHANLVMVIKNGRIVERGTHDKLMKVNGHYSKLWTRQLQLQNGEERSRSPPPSPEKATVLVNDPTNNDTESIRGLSDKRKHKDRSEGNFGFSGEGGNGKIATDVIMDGKVRGRSLGRNDESVGEFDSIQRQILRPKSPEHEKDAPEARRSQSHSPTRTSLKPDAPEFVPRGLQKYIPYSIPPRSSSQSMDGLRVRSPHVTQSPISEDRSLATAGNTKTKNDTLGDDQPMARSTPELPNLAQGKTTRGELRVSSRQRRKKSHSANPLPISSNGDHPYSEGMTSASKLSKRVEH